MPYKQGKKWRAKISYNGQRHTALCNSKKEAIVWEQKAKCLLKKQGALSKTGTAFSMLCSQYLDFAEINYIAKTYKEKLALCRNLLNFWGDCIYIEDITPELVFEYLKTQLKERSANAANKDRKNISALFNWGEDVLGPQKVPMNPVLSVKKFKHEVALQETYREEEILQLLLSATRVQKLMLNIFLDTAARRNEVINLSWEDINMQERAVRLWTRKTRSGEREGSWLPISIETANELKWLWDENFSRSCPWVFPNPQTMKPYVDPRRWFKKWCNTAGVRTIGFHALRRYVASILNDKHKVSRKVIQNLLRHKKEATTERYMQMIHSNLRDYVGVANPSILAIKD